jgi:hypothetical protein
VKERILFWIDIEFVYFGIAKSFNENYDCDIYAIIDVNEKAKHFFEEQKLIPFKKKWYYLDHVKNEFEPNLDYLKSFEKKYNIKLWNLIYSERSFYKFNEYYKFSLNEILSIVEQECRFYENILDEIKPDFVIIKMTDWHHNQLFYDLCKAKGIKILMTIPTRFGFRCLISENIDKMDELKEDVTCEIKHLGQYLDSFNSFKQATQFTKDYQKFNLHKLKSIIHFFLNPFDTKYMKRYSNRNKTKSKILRKYLSLIIKKKYREFFINKNFWHNISDEKFIFFPMHFEPERTLSTDAPFFTNQLEDITHIAKSIPIDFKLYVKEHPVMKTLGWRDISYYKKILALPNVKLIHPSIKPEILYENCSLVITTTGTAGLEATIHKKPTIVLSDVIYSEISSVYRLESIEKLPHLINKILDVKHDFKDVKRFVEINHQESFEFDSNKLATDFSSTCYYGGFLTDLELESKKVIDFLNNNEKILSRSALHHIKKINEFKKIRKQMNR